MLCGTTAIIDGHCAIKGKVRRTADITGEVGVNQRMARGNKGNNRGIIFHFDGLLGIVESRLNLRRDMCIKLNDKNVHKKATPKSGVARKYIVRIG